MGNKRIEKKKWKRKAEKSAQASQQTTRLEKTPPLMTHKSETEILETGTSAPSAEEKKCAAKKAMKLSVFLEYEGSQVERNELLNTVKQWWKRQGNMVKDLKEADLYAKPEENTLYFTINGSIQGSLPLSFTE